MELLRATPLESAGAGARTQVCVGSRAICWPLIGPLRYAERHVQVEQCVPLRVGY